jgi:D-alanyl-D-alanine carboxypeptidase/D-alanyl-D-alanine-endopeptidase (penicillin-binding protein 4)
MSVRRPPVLLAVAAMLAAAVVAAPTAGASAPSAGPAGSQPIPVAGDSDLGDWATGLPERGPAGAAPTLTATGAQASTETTVADLTSSITTKLVARGKSRGAGTSFSGQVVDMATGKALWSVAPGTPRLPASNQKLVTGYVAMKSLGAPAKLVTPVHQGVAYRSTLYLVGRGDPTLTTSRVASLAQAAATALRNQGITAANVIVDDSLFPAPTNATGWKASWVPDEVAPVRALVVDQVNVMDTSLNAGSVFVAQLRKAGVSVNWMKRGTLERGAPLLASTTSPTVGSMVQTMLNASQNDYAEALYRLAAIKRGYAATWAGAKANAMDVLRRYGVYRTGLSFYDGSGLSRSDRMTVTTALYLVKKMRTQEDVNSVVFASPGMPIAGVSGTLKNRFVTKPTVCAKNIVRAKTGSLSDTVTLSGIAPGKDGRERLFSLLVNYTSNTNDARIVVDALAATSTGCY